MNGTQLTTPPLKALSLWQPWASAIAEGHKLIETRHWCTWYEGVIAIHAAQRWGSDQKNFLRILHEDIQPPIIRNLPFGAVVAVAELHGCVPTENLKPRTLEFMLGNYDPGRWGWLLRDVRPLHEPLPLKGRQGLWTLTAEETRQVLERVK